MRKVLPLALGAAILTGAFGHTQGMLMEKQQPMKMAAAEALYKTTNGASLSIFAVGPFEHFPKRLNTDIRIPHLLSILGTASWNGKVEGVNQLNAEDQKKYGPGDYVPILGVTYWTFRLMAGVGVMLLLIPLSGLLLIRRGVLERRRWFLRVGDPRRVLAAVGEPDGLDLYRDGSPAVGRLRAAQDQRRALADSSAQGRSSSRSSATRCSTG